VSYTLRSGITSGRIDSDALGTFEISDGKLEVDDYETAAALVSQYSVEWSDEDPKPETTVQADEVADDGEDGGNASSDTDVTDEDPQADAVSESKPEDSEQFDASEFVDRTPMTSVIEDIESGDYDEHLDEIESEANRAGVLNALEDRRGDN
jgi:hypothetical protein